MHILFVEDEVISRNNIKRKIEGAGHSIVVFDNSIDAMNYLDTAEPDVVLTDYRLGNVPNGLMLAEHVRRRYPHCVIVLISAFAGFEEAVKALQANADDFIQKPISGYELLDRIYNAYTRRRVWLPYKDKPIEEIPDLKVDRVNRTAEWQRHLLKVTPSEFQILAILTTRPGDVFSFNVLGTAVSKGRATSTEEARINLKTHIKNLRRKLAAVGAPPSIRSVRGEGYKWDMEEASETDD